MIVHDIVFQPRAVQAVVRKRIDTVFRQLHILDRRHLAVRTQPIAVREPVIAQVEELHTVVRGQVRDTPVECDVIDRLLLRHVFVVQVADILHAVRSEQV